MAAPNRMLPVPNYQNWQTFYCPIHPGYNLGGTFTAVTAHQPWLVLGCVTGRCEPGSVRRCGLEFVTDRQ